MWSINDQLRGGEGVDLPKPDLPQILADAVALQMDEAEQAAEVVRKAEERAKRGF